MNTARTESRLVNTDVAMASHISEHYLRAWTRGAKGQVAGLMRKVWAGFVCFRRTGRATQCDVDKFLAGRINLDFVASGAFCRRTCEPWFAVESGKVGERLYFQDSVHSAFVALHSFFPPPPINMH